MIATLAVAAPPRGWVRPAMLPSIVSVATRVSSGRLGEAREQFERLGYFCVDKDTTPGKLVFNRTVTLKDTWAKEAGKE